MLFLKNEPKTSEKFYIYGATYKICCGKIAAFFWKILLVAPELNSNLQLWADSKNPFEMLQNFYLFIYLFTNIFQIRFNLCIVWRTTQNRLQSPNEEATKFIKKLTYRCLAGSQKRLWNVLNLFFQMQPFSTPWKHQKTLQFSNVFRG